MEQKIGIITYHSAYNFGSVLQAYATQKVVESMGFSTDILNYRMKSQYQYYSMLHTRQGIKSFLKDMLHFPQIPQYMLRKKRFGKFIREMNLTEEFREPEDAKLYAERYDTFISGSDQIWNKHSNELISVDWKYMDPYLLTFTERKKVSYASSVVNMTKEELQHISDKIQKFDAVSFREKQSCEILHETAGIESEAVLDPTLLLGKDSWEAVSGELPEKLRGRKFVLYYALEGVKKTKAVMSKLRRFTEERGCELVMITPLSYAAGGKRVHSMIEAGPKEFLALVQNAELVLTNSYHGTLFALNLGTDFYTLREPASKDNRVISILSLLGLNNRIITSLDEVPSGFQKIDFAVAWEKKNVYREKSIKYLQKAIGKADE